MNNNQPEINESTPQSKNQIEGLLWFILVVLTLALVGVLIYKNWDTLRVSLNRHEVNNYAEITVSDGFHHIQMKNGQSWDISYEANHDRNFTGLVRHASTINEPAFAILSHDILVTSQDYANPSLVDTSVSNHHFTWISKTNSDPVGTINLLHTLPMNDDIKKQLDAIKVGDSVIITGWDIYQIQGYDSTGKYIGYWEDSGCNTLLVTAVQVVK
jgi:hypothetical protein